MKSAHIIILKDLSFI